MFRASGVLVDQRRVEVVVRMGPRWEGLATQDDVWGTANELPTSVVRSIELYVEGKPVETVVPFSAFGDLGEVEEVRIQTSSRYVDILLDGGEVAGSYHAVLTFEERLGEGRSGFWLFERRVWSGEFQDDNWERASFRWTVEPE